MKKIIALQNKLVKVLPCMALMFATYASGKVCFLYLHQEKRPEGLKELREF